MIELPAERSTLRRWLVCESGQRWQQATRRFAPAMMPPPLVARVASLDQPSPADPALRDLAPRDPAPGEKAVLLWEVEPTRFPEHCDRVMDAALRWPDTLRLVAGSSLTPRQQVVMSELGVAFTIRQPEHLPRLAGMVAAYFRAPGHFLD